MDAVIIIGLIFLAFMYKGTFKGFVYGVAIVDIFLKIVNYIKLTLLTSELYEFTNKYFPPSIVSVIDRYTKGVLNSILVWVLVAVYIVFLVYTIQVYVKKRR